MRDVHFDTLTHLTGVGIDESEAEECRIRVKLLPVQWKLGTGSNHAS